MLKNKKDADFIKKCVKGYFSGKIVPKKLGSKSSWEYLCNKIKIVKDVT